MILHDRLQHLVPPGGRIDRTRTHLNAVAFLILPAGVIRGVVIYCLMLLLLLVLKYASTVGDRGGYRRSTTARRYPRDELDVSRHRELLYHRSRWRPQPSDNRH
uniref:Uncharacterized protein n=1 Tax=Anopheles atroparvus TaxID=41427 RepID=A0A182INX6_ANOAO